MLDKTITVAAVVTVVGYYLLYQAGRYSLKTFPEFIDKLNYWASFFDFFFIIEILAG